MIAFPLGGVAAGSLSLGGRGQLRDWEIFNRPNKGFSPPYALPSIWVQAGNSKPIARVLEARILPPYEGQDGLGSNNSPGLSRIQAATFTGEYPLAHIKFEDRVCPFRWNSMHSLHSFPTMRMIPGCRLRSCAIA